MRASYIGILLQSGNLFEYLCVVDNVQLQMQLAGKVDKQRVEKLIELVGLQHRRHAYPSQLSGDEAARAGLAVALAANPSLLLADEPTAEVDGDTERQIFTLFEERRQLGGATLIVTHSQALAELGDRIIFLQDGRIINAGNTC